MPDLNSYLAAHYLTTDSKPSKKRKRKHAKPSDGLVIADDDEPGWTKPSNSDDDNDPEIPTTVAGTSAEFRRAKKSAWKTVGGPSPQPSRNKQDDSSRDEADAILASAAAESAAVAAGQDEAPAVVLEGGGKDAEGDVRMSDGTFAGLQSAKAISAQLAARRAEEMAELDALEAERRAKRKAKKKKGGHDDDEEEEEEEDQVVLRDATGRRVDVSMARADARRAAAEAEAKARRDEEARVRALKGDVQLEEARRRKEALRDAALIPLARGRDDEEMNAEMRAARRWNDPMAQFLGPGDDAGGGGKGGGGRKAGGGKSRRPTYNGAAPPNRYGIQPGYRWDGVDRGNGFEAERFKALNRRERNKGLEYAWQMDE